MTGTVARPSPPPSSTMAAAAADVSTTQTLSPLYVNSFRISAVTSRLLAHVRGQTNTDQTEFCNLCLSLARGIDYAVSNNDVPGRATDLPSLLKQVCQMKNDPPSQAAIMVLMISVKSACSNGWFSEKMKEELYALSDEMQSSFCSVSVDKLNFNVKSKESNLHPTISTIMSRFYPGMKMGEVLSLVETTKPGYDSYVTDLHISKSSRTSPTDKIYLFVAQIDNIDTSACLISPQQVNILLNGEGVEKRTCVNKDRGPQMPTHVTHMLKYGSNLLQVVGQFNGRYIIVIAFMSVVPTPSSPTTDYIPPNAAKPDSDNDEIMEGPSKILLTCPISRGRIKTPVKGHSCKHLQCFDFNNYVGMNSRTPLWRCPHCNQSVNFHDIRIDQSMAKVLKEVGEDVSYVKISGDGSWEADLTETPNDAQPSVQEPTSQNVDDIMDLTENDIEINRSDKDDDTKPGESSAMFLNISPHREEGFWRDLYSSALNDIQRNHLNINSLTQGQGQGQGQSQSQSEAPVFSNMQSQQNESPNSNNNNNNNNGHVRYPTPAAWVTRPQSAIQALPVQNSRTVDVDRQQNVSRSHPNQHTSSQSQVHHSSQNHTSPQLGARSISPQPISGNRHTSPQPTSGNRHTSPLSSDYFTPHQNQTMSQRSHLPARFSSQVASHVRLGGANGGVGSMTSPASSPSAAQYSLAAIQRATSQINSQTQSISPPIQTSVSSSVPVATGGDKRGGSVEGGQAEESWRPTGRMRGSLSGQQFTEALRNQNIIQPSQPVQAARPPPVLNTPRPFIPPHFQAFMANSNSSPPAGGSAPGSDSSTVAGADTDAAADK